MKSLKYAPLAIALFLSFAIHLFMSYDFYNWNLSYQKVVPMCLGFTGIYFVLSLVAIGFFIIEPYKKINAVAENKKKSTNWFWFIYLSGWLLPIFAFFEFGMFDFIPLKIGRFFFDFALGLFFIKGLFLIPALLFYSKLSERKPISPIGYLYAFIEVIIVVIFIFAFLALREMGDFGL